MNYVGTNRLRTKMTNSSTIKLLTAFCAFGMLFSAAAKDWFAAPDAKTDGTGTIDRPWPLHFALTQSATIKPGDTLFLRGGTYHGPFYSTLNGASTAYVTVQSYRNEWAVLDDDSIGTLQVDLGPALPNSTTVISIAGSENWVAALALLLDDECLQLLQQKGPGSTNWAVVRGWSGTIPTSHSAGTRVYLTGQIVVHTGGFVCWKEFEITSKRSTDRVEPSVRTGNLGNTLIYGGINCLQSGKGNKLINLLIHDVGHPGIGFWNQGEGAEIYGCLIYANGHYAKPSSPSGSGIYANNIDGKVVIKNNISFWNFTTGAKAFSGGSYANDVEFEGNIMFNNGMFNFEAAAAEFPLRNTSFSKNISFYSHTGSPWTNNTSMMVGYYTDSGSATLLGNTILGGACGLNSRAFTNVLATGNIVYMPHGGSYAGYIKKPAFGYTTESYVLKSNTYYTLNPRAFGVDGQWYGDWKRWQVEGFDTAGSTVHYDKPPLFLTSITTNLYDPHRFTVALINYTNASQFPLCLDKLGFQIGDKYLIRDVQDFLNPYLQGTYDGDAVNLGLSRTNCHSVNGRRTFSHFQPEHTNVRDAGVFNVFIVQRSMRHDDRIAPASGLKIEGSIN